MSTGSCWGLVRKSSIARFVVSWPVLRVVTPFRTLSRISRKSPRFTGGIGRAVILDETDGVGDEDGGGGVALPETKLGVDSLPILNSLRGRMDTEEVGDDIGEDDSELDHEGDVGLIG